MQIIFAVLFYSNAYTPDKYPLSQLVEFNSLIIHSVSAFAIRAYSPTQYPSAVITNNFGVLD